MRNVMKYDLKAVFRLWWIFSAAALGVGVLGGLCLRVLINSSFYRSEWAEQVAYSSAGAGVTVFALALGAYWLGTFILLVWRYYTHFFTDEGYLTFTLPVSRTALLGSKLLTALIYQIGAGAVMLLSLFLFVTVGTLGPDYFPTLREIGRSLAHIEWSGEVVLFLVQGVLLMLAAAALQVLYPYLCATIGAAVAKKQKLLAGVGIFFGGRMLLSFVTEFGFIFFGLMMFDPIADSPNFLLWLEFAALLTVSALAAGCWFLNLYLLKKKLNLS